MPVVVQPKKQTRWDRRDRPEAAGVPAQRAAARRAVPRVPANAAHAEAPWHWPENGYQPPNLQNLDFPFQYNWEQADPALYWGQQAPQAQQQPNLNYNNHYDYRNYDDYRNYNDYRHHDDYRNNHNYRRIYRRN